MNRPLFTLFALLVVALTSGAARAQEVEPDEPEEPARSAPSGGANQAAVQKLFEIIRSEPSIKEVQAAALKYYKLEPSRIHGMARSARLKGLIPEIEGSFDQSRGTNFSNMRDGLYPILPSPPENPNPQSYKERLRGEQSQYTWRVRAVFQLDRLAFNAEALDVKSLNSLGENLVREVTALYFSRRRLLASLILSPPSSDEELFYELTRLDELTATLDAITGGMFGKRAWKWESELN